MSDSQANSPQEPDDIGELNAPDWLSVSHVIRAESSQERFARYLFNDVASNGPLRCQWHIERRAGGLAIEGHLAGDLTLECDTCGQPFLHPIALGIDELYVLSQYAESDAAREKELLTDDFYEVVKDDSQIDLHDLAHQYLIMETAHHPGCQQPSCPSAVVSELESE